LNTTVSLASEDPSIVKIEFKLDSCFYNVDQGCVGTQDEEYLQENAFPERPSFLASIRLSSPAMSIDKVTFKSATTISHRTVTGFFYFVEIHVLLYSLGGNLEQAPATPTFNPYESIDLAANQNQHRTNGANQPANLAGSQPVSAPINQSGSASIHQPVNAPNSQTFNSPVNVQGNQPANNTGNQSAAGFHPGSGNNPPSSTRVPHRVTINRTNVVATNLLDDCSSSHDDDMQIEESSQSLALVQANKRRK